MITLSNIKLELMPTKESLEEIKWYLSNNTVYLGNVKIEDNLEGLLDSTFGNEPWLWEESDIFRFSNNTKHLVTAKLNLLSDIEVVNDNYIINYNEVNFSLIKARSEEKVRSIFPESTLYYRGNNVLISFYNESEVDKELKVNNSLYFLLSENKIVGWRLNNASTFLYSSASEKSVSSNLNDNLVKYLNLCNEEAYNLMEDEDIEMLNVLKSLKSELSKTSKKENAIIEAIDGLIEGYY